MPGSEASVPLGADRLVAGRYRLVGPIARGGMAEVWSGHDEVLSRPVAVKVLLGHLSSDEAVRERFRREAITAARLAHPNVVATFDTGLDGDLAYIVMELVPGRTLRDLLAERGPLPVNVALSVADQIADALGSAHRAGLVHRDIKPANVLVAEDDGSSIRVKVTDFGIAKAAEEVGGDLTITGTVIGTPKYLSPEQVEGREPDARADLYALGVVLFEMLTGRAPFEGPTQMATALSHLRDEAPQVSSLRAGAPPALDDLVAALLAKDPDGRFASAGAVRAAALAAVQVGAPAFPEGRPGTSRVEPPTGVITARDATTVAAVGGSVGAGAPTRIDRPPRSARAPLTTAPVTRVPVAPTPADPVAVARTPPRRRIRRWAPGLVVAALVVVGGVVAAVLLTRAGEPTPKAAALPPTAAPVKPLTEVAAQVVEAPGHSPDNASQIDAVIDGNPATDWRTDIYKTATFGGLYTGVGVAVELSGTSTLHTLTVTSGSTGWTAQAYVGTTAPPADGLTDPASVYGAATGSATSTGTTTTLSLGGRTGSWVLLWLTSTGGPPYRAVIAGLSIS